MSEIDYKTAFERCAKSLGARVAELEGALRIARMFIDPDQHPKTIANIDAVLAHTPDNTCGITGRSYNGNTISVIRRPSVGPV